MKQLFSILIFIIIAISSQGQDYRSPTLWQDEVIVDGSNTEWQHPFRLHNTSAGVSFSIANDSSYLYLSFETKEPLYVVKMLRASWYFQLSSKERKRRFNVTVAFDPMFIELEPKHDYVENKEKEGPTFENWLDDYRLESNTYTIQGLKHEQRIALTLDDTRHNLIRVRLGYNEEKAVYEIAIPLKELMPMAAIEWNERMKLKVYIDALDAPSEKGKLSVGTGSFQSIGRQGRQTIPPSSPPQELVQPKKLTEGATKDCLYYKASFSHEFYLVSEPK
ncbi:MAG: Unknown protein [uncultured Aureispira sp.]|uniref:Uncharacterized protein n=1 Tax=uncultured Aureispira sp. TaxID=1331704 RepID=A0A6S6S2A5_9BACT|nr:MAG: Unknown protein [uncultured Aureispira sp.]